MDLEGFKLVFYKYQKYFVYCFIFLFACIAFVIIYVSFKGDNTIVQTETIALNESEVFNENIVEDIIDETIFVDVKGEVNNPGVYEVSNGFRVIDVIEKAGGFTDEAVTDNINLSKKLKDETVIIIPSNSKNYENITIENDYEISGDYGIIDANESENSESLVVLVNLNTASLEELMSLNGIGETKAKAIIEYRDTNGGFKSIEEIMNVSGIGESTYEKIKENISV